MRPPNLRPPSRLKGKYGRPQNGEWIQPILRGYRLGCCDCGLVHQVDFRIKNRKIQFRVFRLNRATAMMRRHMKTERRPHDTER